MTAPATITAPVPTAPPVEGELGMTAPATITAPVPTAPPVEENSA